jgi:hypothetical protein
LVSGAINFGVLVQESASGSDATTTLPIYSVTVAELARASDSILGRLLWEIINDSQSVTWNLINAQNSDTWSIINTADSTTWNVIKTSN